MWQWGLDVAEVCKLCNKSKVGLYWDDCLSMFRNKSGIQLEKMKKKLQTLPKEYDWEIIAESNHEIVNFLELTLTLKDGTFRLYHKPDDQMQYIHTESNHLPNIIKHILVSIENFWSNLCSTEILFKEWTTLQR